jgi:hypothetical protein
MATDKEKQRLLCSDGAEIHIVSDFSVSGLETTETQDCGVTVSEQRKLRLMKHGQLMDYTGSVYDLLSCSRGLLLSVNHGMCYENLLLCVCE